MLIAIEVTMFEVRAGSQNDFRDGLTSVLPILTAQQGYLSHEFGASVEEPTQFWLIVRWKTLEDHTEGFRNSATFEEFVGAFRTFLAKPAEVAHFKADAASEGD